MSTIRMNLISAAINRAFILIDYNYTNYDFHKGYEFMQQTILADNSLTEEEKTEAIRLKNVESASQSWFEEAKSHLTISNKYPEIVQCFEEEQEAFHSKLYDFSVPYNIDGFGKANRNTSKISSIIKDGSKKLSKVFKKLQISSKNDNKDNYNKKIALTQNVNNDEDEDEAYNNPNLHSEEQDEFEIPDDGF
ncbi:kinase-like domain-containing protein [Rhizophagus irregularis DAOM 181602=DAOM 197198]|nr:kinase-like domain-containing protein [Rhizophagus irregularis DAOM 181602=DAOM 197198]